MQQNGQNCCIIFYLISVTYIAQRRKIILSFLQALDMRQAHMYSLSLPLTLPEDRAFMVDDRLKIPPLLDSYPVTCTRHSEEFPQLLVVSGLPDIHTAQAFFHQLSSALRCGSLHLDHGFEIPSTEPVIATLRIYDGQFPTIFKTALNAKPAHTNAYVVMGQHLMTLTKAVDRALITGESERLTQRPELAAAVKIYSEMEFAGGSTAKFVVLLSALEVLVPKTQGGKRGAVAKLVFEALKSAGREDAKAVRKQIDSLYQARNDLVHEARPVTTAQVRELSIIVRDTLRCLVSNS